MKIARALVTLSLLCAGAGACTSPTDARETATPSGPRFDSGYGMGSGSVVEGNPAGNTDSLGQPITTQLQPDSTSRSGYGMGSGS
jgi:hypothetical protein